MRFKVAALLLASGILYYEFALMPKALSSAGIKMTESYDLFVIWNGTRAVLNHENPYSETVTRRIQTGMDIPYETKGDQNRFAYPLYSVPVFAPVALLPFEMARYVTLLLIGVTCLAAIFWFEVPLKFPLIAAILTSSQFIEALKAQQLGTIVLGLIAAAVWAYRKQKSGISGVLMGLALIKPHLALLLAFVMCRNRRFLPAFMATVAFLVGISLMISPGWMGDWIQTVAAYQGYTVPSVLELTLGKWIGLAVALSLAIYSIYKNSFELALAVTVIAAPNARAIYNELLLIPCVVLILLSRQEFESRPRKWLFSAFLVLALWPWVSATAISALSLVGVQPSLSVLAIPARAFGGFCLATAMLTFLIVRKLPSHSSLAKSRNFLDNNGLPSVSVGP